MRRQTRNTLWELTHGQRLRYGSAIGALGLSILFTFAVPLLVRWALDGILSEDELPESDWLRTIGTSLGLETTTARLLAAAGAGIVLFTALGGAMQALRGRWAATASEAIARGLRDRLYGHLEALPCSYHDRADTGDLVQRCTSDVETVRLFLASQVVEIGRAALLFLGVIPILFALDVGMALVSIVLFPFIVTFAVVFFRRVRQRFLAMDEAEGAMTTVLQENLTGIRVVRAFARQEHEREKFGERNATFRDRTQRLIDLLGGYWALSDVVCLGQIGLVLFAGARWALDGRLTIGELQAFLMYEAMVIWPVRHLGRVLNDTGKAVVALGRMREILEVAEESEPLPGAGDEEAPALRGGIEFDRVGFRYAEGEPALVDTSFSVEPGETLALLGPPGSGKSTVVQLLLRLYDHQAGTIRLDGRDLSSLDRRSVRAQIGAVLQDPFLYSRSLRRNLEVGRAGARDEELESSASIACIHDSILAFTDGYDTLVGERGITLSGGERQRVALARALLKDPAVLILDDALSAVDTRTEAGILDALAERRGRRTTLIVTHRLSSVVHADRVVVLEHGRVVQSGTHASLLRATGPYRRLWEIQGALEQEMAEDHEAAEEARVS